MDNAQQRFTCILHTYDTIESRLETFKNWPIQIINPTSYEFAYAGFYYTQYSDCVACYCCGLRLGKWDQDNDPINEHSYWATKEEKICSHLTNLLSDATTTTTTTTTTTGSDARDLDRVVNNNDNDDNHTVAVTAAGAVEAAASRETTMKPEEYIDNTCKVCWLKPVNNVLIPCGHVICKSCRPKIVKCHICRNRILTYNPLYL